MQDLEIAWALPICLTISMGVNVALSMAFEVFDLFIAASAFLACAAILICVTDAWLADPADLPDDPESTAAAWAGLRRAVTHSMVSALFLASMVYLSSASPCQSSLGPGALETNDPGGFLWGFVAGSNVMLALCLGLSFAGGALPCRGRHDTDAPEARRPDFHRRAQPQAGFRLFAGGIHLVRPALSDAWHDRVR